MPGGTWKELFLIDLDVASATDKALSLKAAVQGIGDQKNLDGLISGLIRVGAIAGSIGAIMYGAKKAFDFTMEAESIRATEKQFELLSSQAGVNSEKLATGLKSVADGLIGENEALQIANKSLITLGKSSERLPEILDLAKRAAAVTGGSVQDVFERLTQAISAGQTRALKSMGIIVDQEKAYRDYAKSIGVATDALSEQGKRQALLNEVLSKGGQQLAGVDVNIREAANTWTRFKVTMQDIGETIAIGFDKIAGPAVKGFLSDLSYAAGKAKEYFQATYGEGPAQLEAQVARLKERIGNVTENISNMEAKKGSMWFRLLGDPEVYISRAKENLGNLDKELLALQAKLQKARDEGKPAEKFGPEAAPGSSDAALVDAEKKRVIESNLAKEIIAIRQQTVQAELQNYTTVEEARRAAAEQEKLLEQEREVRRAELIAKGNLENINVKEQLALTDQLYAEKRQTLHLQLLTEIDNAEVASAQRRSIVAEGAWNKFAAGAALASAKAKKSLGDFSKFGESATTTLATAFGNAFQDIGTAGWQLGDAMKKAMIGAIADIAQAKGRELIAASIWPPQPLGLAAGAALIALGGVLRASVGAPSSVPGGGATAGGSAAPETPKPVVGETPEPDKFEAEKRKAVTIQVMGHFFETDETRRKLTEMIREESDATDFKILSVGGRV